MQRLSKRTVEKLETFDFSTGTIHARTLPRTQYHHSDFLDYLNSISSLDEELSLDEGP